ncbi:MAG: hypothetical protein GY913_27380 [Proteobacteria bacterium]|nr:hypothetical protein [Pseudomonadota bacterium]MCP4920638.1 hypothetical protein [Pseudomonadota bacterium]
MKQTILSTTVLLALVGCAKGTVDGTVTDGLTGAGVSELRVLAKSDDAADLTCMVLEGTTDASGAFKIEGTCANATYTLSSADDTRFFEGDHLIEGGGPIAGHAITSYRAPEGSGVYLLVDGELKPQKTYSDVSSATILKTDQVVKYPETKPPADGWPEIAADSHVLLLGGKAIGMTWIPAHDGPEIKFDPDREGITHWSLGEDGWVYLGVVVRGQDDYEVSTSALDDSKAISVSGAGRTAKYLPADAIPAGRYAVMGEKSKRAYVFEKK